MCLEIGGHTLTLTNSLCLCSVGISIDICRLFLVYLSRIHPSIVQSRGRRWSQQEGARYSCPVELVACFLRLLLGLLVAYLSSFKAHLSRFEDQCALSMSSVSPRGIIKG